MRSATFQANKIARTKLTIPLLAIQALLVLPTISKAWVLTPQAKWFVCTKHWYWIYLFNKSSPGQTNHNASSSSFLPKMPTSTCRSSEQPLSGPLHQSMKGKKTYIYLNDKTLFQRLSSQHWKYKRLLIPSLYSCLFIWDN